MYTGPTLTNAKIKLIKLGTFALALWSIEEGVYYLEIKDICITIHILQKDLHSAEQKITQTLPLNVYQRFSELERKKVHRIFLSHNQTCKYKFESFQIKKRGPSQKF